MWQAKPTHSLTSLTGVHTLVPFVSTTFFVNMHISPSSVFHCERLLFSNRKNLSLWSIHSNCNSHQLFPSEIYPGMSQVLEQPRSATFPGYSRSRSGNIQAQKYFCITSNCLPKFTASKFNNATFFFYALDHIFIQIFIRWEHGVLLQTVTQFCICVTYLT